MTATIPNDAYHAKLYQQALNEICKNCGKERRRNGSAYGERCARIHKGLSVPEKINKGKDINENHSSSKA